MIKLTDHSTAINIFKINVNLFLFNKKYSILRFTFEIGNKNKISNSELTKLLIDTPEVLAVKRWANKSKEEKNDSDDSKPPKNLTYLLLTENEDLQKVIDLLDDYEICAVLDKGNYEPHKVELLSRYYMLCPEQKCLPFIPIDTPVKNSTRSKRLYRITTLSIYPINVENNEYRITLSAKGLQRYEKQEIEKMPEKYKKEPRYFCRQIDDEAKFVPYDSKISPVFYIAKGLKHHHVTPMVYADFTDKAKIKPDHGKTTDAYYPINNDEMEKGLQNLLATAHETRVFKIPDLVEMLIHRSDGILSGGPTFLKGEHIYMEPHDMPSMKTDDIKRNTENLFYKECADLLLTYGLCITGIDLDKKELFKAENRIKELLFKGEKYHNSDKRKPSVWEKITNKAKLNDCKERPAIHLKKPDELNKNDLVLIMIAHDREFYKKKKIADPYQINVDGITQHIILFEDDSDHIEITIPALVKCLTELTWKYNLKNEKCPLLPFLYKGKSERLHFGTFSETGGCVMHVDTKNGKLSFEEWTEDEEFENMNCYEIMAPYEGDDKPLDAIFWDDDNTYVLSNNLCSPVLQHEPIDTFITESKKEAMQMNLNPDRKKDEIFRIRNKTGWPYIRDLIGLHLIMNKNQPDTAYISCSYMQNGLQTSAIGKAPGIRKINIEGPQKNIEDYLPLFYVNIITSSDRLTVLPYMYKYLHEKCNKKPCCAED